MDMKMYTNMKGALVPLEPGVLSDALRATIDVYMKQNGLSLADYAKLVGVPKLIITSFVNKVLGMDGLTLDNFYKLAHFHGYTPSIQVNQPVEAVPSITPATTPEQPVTTPTHKVIDLEDTVAVSDSITVK